MKAKKKPTKHSEPAWGFEDPVVEGTAEVGWGFDDASALKTGEATLSGKTGRKGKRQLQVTIEYDAHGVKQGDMIREVIASRGVITEQWNDPDYVCRMFYNLGHLPAWVLAGDPDRWQLFLYAAETLRSNPDWLKGNKHIEEMARASCRSCGCKRHPSTDEMKDILTIWGDVEGSSPKTVQTVRAQMEKAKTSLIDRTRSEAVPAAPDDGAQKAHEAHLAKWVMCEKLARKPRKDWEGRYDFEMEQMIKYCYGWLRDIGEVPDFPVNNIDLFWQRPRPGSLMMSDGVVSRRNFITGKVMKFLRKSMGQDDVRDKLQTKRDPLSYRVVLAARRLSTQIEFYADPDPIHGTDDEVLAAKVKKAAMRYFKAHFPVELEGAKPGPLATLDPGYVEYVQLCRKYNLKEGILLHEAEL